LAALGGTVTSAASARSDEDEGQEGQEFGHEQDGRKDEDPARGVLGGQGPGRVEQVGIVPDGDGPDGGSRGVQDVPGYVNRVAMAVEGEGAPTGVAGPIGATAAQEAETAGDPDVDGDAVLVEAVDLGVLGGAGQEEDDDQDGQAEEAEDEKDRDEAARVDRDAGAAQGPDPA
jgi:hypothetical protein